MIEEITSPDTPEEQAIQECNQTTSFNLATSSSHVTPSSAKQDTSFCSHPKDQPTNQSTTVTLPGDQPSEPCAEDESPAMTHSRVTHQAPCGDEHLNRSTGSNSDVTQSQINQQDTNGACAVPQSEVTHKAPPGGEHPIFSHKFDFSPSAPSGTTTNNPSASQQTLKTGHKRKIFSREGNVTKRKVREAGIPTSAGK